jgi:hypothetical protein
MKTTTLFVSILVLSVAANRLDNIFSEVSESEYGKTLVSTLQLQLQSGAHVDDLIVSMNGVVDGLKTQMADAEAVAEAKHDACDADARDLIGQATQMHADYEVAAAMMALDAFQLMQRQAEMANKQQEMTDR